MAMVQSTDNFQVKKKWCFGWTKLILSAFIPLILGGFTVIFTFQQDRLTRLNREQDLKIAGDNREQEVREREKIIKQTVYDSYIAEISKTILNHEFNRSDVKQLQHIRIQTLNALHQLDLNQKREVIVFLYENGLIRANSSKPVSLRGADLTGVKFVRSASFLCDLNNLYLAEVLADNIVFDECRLQNSVFDGASLNGAKFLNSYAAHSSYEGAYMVRFVFNETNKLGANFASADLRNASFRGSGLAESNCKNTDLLGSDLMEDTLNKKSNTFINTRFPNGSFSAIDTKQMIKDGGAEIRYCNGSSRYWTITDSSYKIYIANKSYYNGSIQDVEGNCFFKFVTRSDAKQTIFVQEYSVFIDSGQAWYNLSAHMMCRSAKSSDETYVKVSFLMEDAFVIQNASRTLKSKQGTTSFYKMLLESKIPAETHWINIYIGANMASSIPIGNQTNECFIDHIQFYIFK